MKQLVIDIMAAAMPYMDWLLWAGAVLAALGALLTLAQLAAGAGSSLNRLVLNLLIVVGLVFLACQGVGAMLGMTPQINFEFITGEKFDLRPFWQIGAVFTAAGIILKLLSKLRAH